MPQHIVCFSGGHSSALVGIEVARRYGTADLVLLNHDINPRVEDVDIKRFKREVAEYIGVPVTYANYAKPEWDQFDIALYHSAFKAGNNVICTHRLKTEPFEKWLSTYAPFESDCVIYYGFDLNEPQRIQRRAQLLGARGYATAFPLAAWPRTIHSTREVGIEPPLTYSTFKHANCIGCIKAGKQHWYVVFCTRPDIWEKAKSAEEEIGYSIIKGSSLQELEPLFAKMRCAGIEASEKLAGQTFWALVRRTVGTVEVDDADIKPCECVI